MRTSSFATIGIDISQYTTSSDVLSAADLDYQVIKKPMFFLNDKNAFEEYPDKLFTANATTGKIYGVVSNKYEVCQNSEAFSFIDYIGKDCDGFQYVKAGETEKGLIYIIARIPNVTILGDAVTPYIIFQNSHDGQGSIRATISPLRIICQNQFNISFKESKNTVRIIHSSKMDSRILTARNMMKDVAGYMQTFNANAERLSTKHINYSDVIQIFNEVFAYNPNTMSLKQQQNFEFDRGEFLACYNNDDNQNFVGTAWGVINGAADYLTHHKSRRKTSDDAVFVNTTLLSVALNKIYQKVSD
jgi:phage/plasmid-like protein (TIGR03299 family)